jgi:hypothetical protein
MTLFFLEGMGTILISSLLLLLNGARTADSSTVWPCDPNALLMPQGSGALTLDENNCKCSLGYFGNGKSCSQCAAGSYQPGLGQSVCTQCQAGFYATAVGATAHSSCLTCNESYTYTSSTGSTVCLDCQVCSSSQYLNRPCAIQSNSECLECSVCAKGKFAFRGCTATSDTICDEDVPVYIVFVSHIDLGMTQFSTKPRTYLVSVGVSLLGVPTVDSKGNNVTEAEWAEMTILQKVAAFEGLLGIGEGNETGSGLIKTVFMQTAVRVTGPKAAAAIIEERITCDGCLDTMRAVFIAQGFTDSTGKDLLLNISEAYITPTLNFPLTSAAPPSVRPASLAAALAAAAAAFFIPVLQRAAQRE